MNANLVRDVGSEKNVSMTMTTVTMNFGRITQGKGKMKSLLVKMNPNHQQLTTQFQEEVRERMIEDPNPNKKCLNPNKQEFTMDMNLCKPQSNIELKLKTRLKIQIKKEV